MTSSPDGCMFSAQQMAERAPALAVAGWLTVSVGVIAGLQSAVC